MQLGDYLKQHNLSENEFAQSVGVEHSTIGRLIPKNGNPPARKPSFELMSRIAAATGGKVMPNDFLDDLPELIEGFEQEAKDGGAGPAEIRRAG